MAIVEATKLAYFAGIIDGEGTITLERHSPTSLKHPSPTFSASLYVSNTNMDVLKALQDTFCGSIAKHKQNSVSQKEIYRWRLYGTKAISVIGLVSPYLIIKRKQAEIVLAYQIRPKEKLTGKVRRLTIDELNYRESVVNRIRELNRRGVTSLA